MLRPRCPHRVLGGICLQTGSLVDKVVINPRNALSPKPAHQEIDRRDDFDAVNVGRRASPANDDDLLVTAGDLLERPKLKWTQLALARRLLVNRLCNLGITKVYQLIEISILGTIRLSIARPNLQVFLIT